MQTDANSAFAFDLYRQLIKENSDENIFISPFSIAICLSMALEGARGKTADEMAAVLQIPNSQKAAYSRSVCDLLKVLNRGQNDPALVEIRARISALRETLRELEAREQPAGNVVGMELAVDFAEGDYENERNEVAREINRLLPLVDQFELGIANALWGEQTYPFRQDFLGILTSLYGSDALMSCDFRHNHQSEVVRINQWASKNTNGKINGLLSKDDLNPSTALVLMNAIYFKGDWVKPFKAESTKSQPFYCISGEKITTPLMENRWLSWGRYATFNADDSFFETPHYIAEERDGFGSSVPLLDFDRDLDELESELLDLDGSLDAAEEPESESDVHPEGELTWTSTKTCITDEKDGYPGPGGVQVLELPYKGDEVSMLVLLPHCTEDLATLEAKLNPTLLRSYMEKLQPRQVEVTLPKFKCETRYDLNDALETLGMSTAFIDPTLGEGADFSGMADMTETTNPLFIGLVIHQAMVDVNEKGTEAAAVTAIAAEAAGAIEETPFVPKFRADRPFIYLIVHRDTQTILFLGRMTEPDNNSYE